MKNRNRFYILCFTGIAFILVALLLLSGAIMIPWAGNIHRSDTTAYKVVGDVSVHRGSGTYQLKAGMELLDGDLILVGRDGYCGISTGNELRILLERDCNFRLLKTTQDARAYEVENGAAFFELGREPSDKEIVARAGKAAIYPEKGCIFSVEAYTGTQNVDVYAGNASLEYDSDRHRLSTVDHVSMIQGDGTSEIYISDTVPASMRDFIIRELVARDGLCFTVDELNGILLKREEDVAAVDPEWLKERMTCTFEIRCDSVLSELDLTTASEYNDGTVFPMSQVKFSRGETVFEILQRICRTNDIPLTYTYTVAYGGYYVSEISGLREIEHGALSGWMYKVNGWYPNYGSSKYEVNEGDVIVWTYTCDGGKDLGLTDWLSQK